MPDIGALTQSQPESSPNIVSAEVREAPEDLSDELKVAVPSFAEDRLYEIRYWMPRGADMPIVGDRGLVAFDENGEPWLVAWWPEGS